MKEFKENLLFEMFKNEAHFSKQKQREKIKKVFPDIDLPKIHKKITNYQVSKFGESLDGIRKIERTVKVL